MKTASSFILSLIVGASAHASWTQISLAYVAVNKDSWPVLVQNSGSAPITLGAAAGNVTKRSRIVGAAAMSDGPAWDHRFNPLTDANVTVNWSHGTKVLDAGHWFWVWVQWQHSTGDQQFQEVGGTLVVRRDRDYWVHLGTSTGSGPTRPSGFEGGGGAEE